MDLFFLQMDMDRPDRSSDHSGRDGSTLLSPLHIPLKVTLSSAGPLKNKDRHNKNRDRQKQGSLPGRQYEYILPNYIPCSSDQNSQVYSMLAASMVLVSIAATCIHQSLYNLLSAALR